MTDTTQIQLIIRQSGYKMQHVAMVLGLSPATLRSRLNGLSEFKLSEAEKLSALLSLSEEQREMYFFGAAGGNAAPPERRAAND